MKQERQIIRIDRKLLRHITDFDIRLQIAENIILDLLYQRMRQFLLNLELSDHFRQLVFRFPHHRFDLLRLGQGLCHTDITVTDGKRCLGIDSTVDGSPGCQCNHGYSNIFSLAHCI